MNGYLKSLGIMNFLNHKELLVEFCPGFNVISGPSDSGKSGVLRSISWIAQNDPTGDAIKNWDASKSESVCAEMVFEDLETKRQESVIKERVGSTSSYTLSTMPESLSVVGRNVPLEALELINFSDLNFKGQHDPYLLSLSGGEFAKKINELVGLSDIDVSLKNLNSKANATKRECDRLSSEIDIAVQNIESMDYLKPLGLDIAEIEELEKQLKGLSGRYELLNKTIEDIKSIREEIKDNESVLDAGAPTEEIRDLFIKLQEKENRKKAIASLVSTIQDITQTIQTEENWLQAREPSQDLLSLITKLNENESAIALLESATKTIISLKSQISQQDKSILEKERDLEEFLTRTKTCPTCGQPFTKVGISMMVKK